MSVGNRQRPTFSSFTGGFPADSPAAGDAARLAAGGRPVSVISFLNIAMHGHVDPTLPIVAELVRRGHRVTYHTSPAFAKEIEAAGADVHLYPGGEQPLPDPVGPVTLLDGLARTALTVLPAVLDDLRHVRPDLIVHDSMCPWGAVAARELGVPAASSFTTFAFDRITRSPCRPSWRLLAAAATRPRAFGGYVRSRWRLHRDHDSRGLPLIDLANVRQPLNLVHTSRTFQPGGGAFDESYRFAGPSVGARRRDPSFPADRLDGPVLYASLGMLPGTAPLLRTLAAALAPLADTVVVSTGRTDPAALGPLPGNVLARRRVPQPDVLSRAALFVTHGGMNSVSEAIAAGVPMLVVPHGADQPLVARRITELGAGLSIRPGDATVEAVEALARRILDEPRFELAAASLQAAEREAGGYQYAVGELERYLRRVSQVSPLPAGSPLER